MKPDKARAHHLAQLAQGRRLIVAAERGLRALAKAARASQKQRPDRRTAPAIPADAGGSLGRL